MEKYQRHDLKVTKGDLDGLTPYLVAQITSIVTSGRGPVGMRRYAVMCTKRLILLQAHRDLHVTCTCAQHMCPGTWHMDALSGTCLR